MNRMRLTYPDTTLLDVMKVVNQFVDETTITVDGNGLRILDVDNGLVSTIDLKIKDIAFERFEVEGKNELPLSIGRLIDVLKRAGNGDRITMMTKPEKEGKVYVVIESGLYDREFEVPLFDLTKNEIPPIEALEFKSTADVRLDALENAIKDAMVISDALKISMDSERLVFSAEGEVTNYRLPLERNHESIVDLRAQEPTEAKYPIEHLKKICGNGVKKMFETVRISTATNYPAKFEMWNGDKINMSVIVAPRMVEED